MYNTDIPARAELPTSKELLRSTILAATTAAVLLVTTILPAEYGIDPTGIGRMLGLTEMGEIKAQLAEEAEADRAADRNAPVPAPAAPVPERQSSLVGKVLAQLAIGSAWAAPAPLVVAQAGRTDTTTLTLRPSEGAEVKMVMNKGAVVTYSWKVEGGVVNHDTHGEPHDTPDATHSYRKGRGVASEEGTLQAVFDGNHGWFWRNRTKEIVTVTLTTSGEYIDIKRVL